MWVQGLWLSPAQLWLFPHHQQGAESEVQQSRNGTRVGLQLHGGLACCVMAPLEGGISALSVNLHGVGHETFHKYT